MSHLQSQGSCSVWSSKDLPDFLTSSAMYLMEKAMAPHSSTLAWKIPWMEEPGGLQSMGSIRVRHDWATSLSLFAFMCWRRKWQPTPVFLPGESWGRRSQVGCLLWGRTESDTTERLHFHFSLSCVGEGNGNPLQCSCLESPGDCGARWAAVYVVAQSRTWLKWLNSLDLEKSMKWIRDCQLSLILFSSRISYLSDLVFTI